MAPITISYDHRVIIAVIIIRMIILTWNGHEGRVGKLDDGGDTGQEDGNAPRVGARQKHFSFQLPSVLPLTVCRAVIKDYSSKVG